MKNPDNPIQRLRFVQDKMLSNPAQNKAQMMMFLLPSSFLCFVDHMSYVPQNESIWRDISRKHHQHPQCVQPFQRVFRGLLVFTLPCNAICCDRQAKWIPGAFYVLERHWNSTMWNSAKLASMVNFHDRSSFFQPTFEGRQFGESTKASNGGSRIHCLWRWGSKASNIYIVYISTMSFLLKKFKNMWLDTFLNQVNVWLFICVLGLTSHYGCFTPHAACLG